MTFTYNENVNLPLWIRYYGSQFGEGNLFVSDRGSDDDSLASIGKANLVRLPRNEFDEFEKTNFINNFHAALLNFYDVVIYTDCDEFLIPDPAVHRDLKSYVSAMPGDCVRAIGIDVLHVRPAEAAIDLSRPILSQREYGRYGSHACKALISKSPLRWLPGFHSCDRKVEIDPSLILFHLKYMDFDIATRRQIINLNTVWSKRSVDLNFGAHHRWDMARFQHQGFEVPADIYNRNLYSEFEFSQEIEQFREQSFEADGYWHIPMDARKYVRLPEKYRALL